MSLKIYNTKTASKEIFVPNDPGRVCMYVCGPTVYNRVHIGNARPAVVFDTLFRLLKTLYSNVVYARNITDIDDKIIAVSAESGEPIASVTQRFTQAYTEDMAELNNQEPTLQPHATEHIEQMIAMTSQLIERGHAYEAENHVLFAVQSMPDYGQLSGRSLDDMLAGARVEVAPYKKYAGDFVLWKPSSDNEPGWDSPWGRGRPGWHLECSAMIKTHLGETIDIHGGGRDLVFPHHENETAQSECAHGGKTFVQYWMHNGYINIDGEKMSKSLGNFRLVRDLLEQYDGEVLRFAILSAQYRSELNFGVELLEQAKSALDSLYGVLKRVSDINVDLPESISGQAFYNALLDDLNTPVAIRELHAIAKSLDHAETEQQPALKGIMLACGEMLGLLQRDPTGWFQQSRGSDEISVEEIEEMIQQRVEAKNNKDYALADKIRQQLLDKGIVLEDARGGTEWRRE